MRTASLLIAIAVLPARLALAQGPLEAPSASHKITLYVSATSGNDKWSGRLPKGGAPYIPNQVFVVTGNLMYFDRDRASNPPFDVQGGCTYSGGIGAHAAFLYTSYQLFESNLYWRTDGGFATDGHAFHVQPDVSTTNDKDFPCNRNTGQCTSTTSRSGSRSSERICEASCRIPSLPVPPFRRTTSR